MKRSGPQQSSQTGASGVAKEQEVTMFRTLVRSGLLLALALPAATAAWAQVQQGVGFNPYNVGQTTSRYYVQNPTTGSLSERDFTLNVSVADPLANATEF